MSSPLRTPDISIVIPTFNRSEMLIRCINSVLDQSKDNFDVIVVDDGSTDDTRVVVSRFMKDPRIQYVYKANSGAPDARNLGVSRSNAPVVAFIDSDDEVRNSWVETYCDLMRDENVGLACCGQELFGPDGRVRKVSLPNADGLFLSGTFAVRRCIFNDVGGYLSGLPANQHFELKVRLFKHRSAHNWKISSVVDPLAVRHQHEGENIRSNYGAVYRSCEIIVEKHRDYLSRTPNKLAQWCSIAAVCSAKQSDYSNARRWFCKSIEASPPNWKDVLRLGLTYMPAVREYVWQRRLGDDV